MAKENIEENELEDINKKSEEDELGKNLPAEIIIEVEAEEVPNQKSMPKITPHAVYKPNQMRFDNVDFGFGLGLGTVIINY